MRAGSGGCAPARSKMPARTSAAPGDGLLVELGVAGQSVGVAGGVGTKLEQQGLPHQRVRRGPDRVADDGDEPLGAGDAVGEPRTVEPTVFDAVLEQGEKQVVLAAEL